MLLPAAAMADRMKYEPVEGAVAVTLSMDNAYFRGAGAPAFDYWNLSSFYIPQRNGASCSSASVAMALNALFNSRRRRGDVEENLDEPALVQRISGIKWKALVSEAGENGRRGLTLEQLLLVSREALHAYGGEDVGAAAVQVSTPSAEALAAFRRALAANERNPDDIMLLHFAQDTLTGDLGGPYAHISPVGAYDEKTRRVLIFDVDRRWYEPYWAADVQVLKAMSVKTKAFGHGGYVVLRKGSPQ